MAKLLATTHQSRAFHLAALLGFVVVGLLDVGEAFQQTAAPRQLGKVDVLSGPVQCAGGECYEIQVTCPEVVAPARARLKVAAPAGASPRGTILFTTGNFGFDLYENPAESRRTLADLSAAGFRTVQLQWMDSWLVARRAKKRGTSGLAVGRRRSPVGCTTIFTIRLPARSARPGIQAVHRRSVTC